MKITINNGDGLNISAEISDDADIYTSMEAVSELLHAAGFSLLSIKNGLEDEAERVNNEIESLK